MFSWVIIYTNFPSIKTDSNSPPWKKIGQCWHFWDHAPPSLKDFFLHPPQQRSISHFILGVHIQKWIALKMNLNLYLLYCKCEVKFLVRINSDLQFGLLPRQLDSPLDKYMSSIICKGGEGGSHVNIDSSKTLICLTLNLLSLHIYN